MIKQIKFFIQRGRRGYADCDVWNVHSYLSDLLPKMLRQLSVGYGCPSDLYDKKATNNECHKWTEIIEEIAQGFEAAQFLDKMKYHKWVDSKTSKGAKTLEIDYESLENARKKLDRGLELFKKYYLNLWD